MLKHTPFLVALLYLQMWLEKKEECVYGCVWCVCVCVRVVEAAVSVQGDALRSYRFDMWIAPVLVHQRFQPCRESWRRLPNGFFKR